MSRLTIISFSYKAGLPVDADMVFDVRFLRNPFYDPELKKLTGLDHKAADYIAGDSAFAGFYQQMTALLESFLPGYLEKREDDMVIAIGCTGGQHRSVYVAQKLGEFLEQKKYNVIIQHRELT